MLLLNLFKKRSAGSAVTKILYIWGETTYGRNAPDVSTVTVDRSWISVSANRNTTLAIDSTYKLFGWGQNNAGVIGDGTTVAKSSPVQVGTGVSWTAVSVGFDHALGLDNTGRLFGWGGNGGPNHAVVNAGRGGEAISGHGATSPHRWNFNLQDSNATNRNYDRFGSGSNNNASGQNPMPLVWGAVDGAANNVSWKLVSAGRNHTVAVRSDNLVYAWGNNSTYVLGDGTSIGKSSPVQVTSGNVIFTSISSGNTHNLALDNNGLLYGWGTDPGIGFLGENANTILLNSDSKIKNYSNTELGINGGFLSNDLSWTAVSTNRWHSAAIRSDGKLFTWGYSFDGKLGIGNVSQTFKSGVVTISGNQTYPVRVKNPNLTENQDSWTLVSCGYRHTLAVRSDGKLFTWGSNTYGQLGDGTQINISFPSQIGSSSWIAINAGDYHSFAVRNDGLLFSWGRNNYGQLGDGTTINKLSPVQIGSLSWTAVSGGRLHSLGLTNTNLLYVWGGNTVGQIGLGDSTVPSFATDPQAQVGLSWTSVSGGLDNTFGIKSDKSGWAWGSNTTGKLGDLSTISRSVPVRLPFLWNKIAAGVSHTVGITDGGLLYGWGGNSIGQLGDGTTTNKSSPVLIGSTSIYNDVSVLGTHTVAIRSDGLLFGWGLNNYGQLGDGTTNNKSSPVQIGSSSWASVSAGINHTLAIRSGGTLFGWGSNVEGQLTTAGKFETHSWTTVSSGFSHTVAIRSDGIIFAWGRNNEGQLGNGATVIRSNPVQIGSSSWIAVSTGRYHTAAIRSDGYLFTWGLGTSGELGDGTVISKSSPVQIGSSSWTAVSAGLNTTYAVRSGGTLFAWGLGSSGQLGDVTTISKSSPVQIGSSSWTAVQGGDLHALAILSTGSLYAWGRNNEGQLGDSTTINKSSPVLIGGSSSWSAIGAGVNTSFAIRSGGTLFAWGSNNVGQLGDSLDNNFPQNFSAPALTKFYINNSVNTLQIINNQSWSMLDARESHAVGIRSDGILFAWGVNTSGQLGDGTTIFKSSPVQIGSSSWTVVSAGRYHTSAIRSGGTLFTWGLGTSGQLGDGTAISKSSPVQIGSDSWSFIGAGGTHTSAIRSDGYLFTWGLGTSGQLGDGTTVSKSSPVQIGSSSWTAIQAGDLHSLAIRSGGTLFAWGVNTNGQLGDGTTTNKNSPVQIGSSSWIAVSSGQQHTLGIRSDGILFSWGRNNVGQLGDGTTISKSSPVQIGSSSWTVVRARGDGWSSAIRSGGTLFSWGLNTGGQIGDSSTINKSSPVQIGSSSWTALGGGTNFSLALDVNNLLYSWGTGIIARANDTFRNLPVQIGISSWTAIAAEVSHSVAVRSDGALFAWGLNQNVQLGDGSTVNKYSPVQIGSSISWSTSGLRPISVSRYGSAAINSAGLMYTFGDNNGQNKKYTTFINSPSLLGSAMADKVTFPVQIGSESWTAVSAGLSHSAAIRSDGKLFTWGVNTVGATGLNYASVFPVRFINYDTEEYTNIKVKYVSHRHFTNPFNSAPMLMGIIDTSNNFYLAASGSPASLVNTIANYDTPMVMGDGRINKTPRYQGIALDFRRDNPNLQTGYTYYIDNLGRLWAYGFSITRTLGFGEAVGDNVPAQLIVGSSFTALSTGLDHLNVISTTGKIWSWGGNGFGQVGNGTTITQSFPVQIGSSSWTIVFSGAYHTVGIRSGGTLFTWGRNDFGQLGDGTTVNKSSPVQIGSSSWIAVSCGNFHTFAIDSNYKLFTWGRNHYGQLGDSTTVNKSSPVQIGSSSWTILPKDFTNNHSHAIRSDGILFSWGLNDQGSLGDGTTINRSSPVTLSYYDGIPKSFIMVTGGQGTVNTATTTTLNSTFAIDINNDLFCWGGTITNPFRVPLGRSSPVAISVANSWTAVSSGQNHTFAVTNTGQLYGAGLNNIGQIGVRNLVDQHSFVQTSPFAVLGSWTAVAASSGSHTVAIADGKLLSWGLNTSNQLARTMITEPTTLNLSSWTAISAGQSHSVAIRSGGTLFTWGLNSSGQLGDGTTISKSSPVQIGSSSWTTISSKINLTLGTIGTNAYAWGLGTSGQLGDGTTISKSSPVQIGTGLSFNSGIAGGIHSFWLNNNNVLYSVGPSTDAAPPSEGAAINQIARPLTVINSIPKRIGSSSWTAVSAGVNHSLAIRSDGLLFGFGLNNAGQLGDGTTVNKIGPTQIGSSSWIAVKAAVSHSVAVRSGGTLFSWGRNNEGQLGDGTTINKSSPVQIGSSSWTAIEAGDVHSLAIRSDNLLFVWGTNNFGQLGLGNVSNRWTRIESPFATGWATAQISTGLETSTNTLFGVGAAIRTDGTLWAWGPNTNGSVGDGTTIARSFPVQIGSSSWTAISCGLNNFMVAIRSGGTLFSWGQNDQGQLGDGTTVNKSSPVQIGSSSWIAVSAANGNVLAIRSDGALFSWGRNNSTSILGDATTVNKSSPVQIGSALGVTFTDIDMSTQAAFAVTSNGQIYSWGDGENSVPENGRTNQRGQTGDANFVDFFPIKIDDGTKYVNYSWNAVASGNGHTVAIRSDGLLWAWGQNASGQLGDGSTIDRLSPTQIGSSSWIAVSVGLNHTIAVRSGGTLFTWGLGTGGQLGDGTVISKSSPVQIGSSSWTAVSSWDLHTAAIRSDGALFTWGPNGNGQLGDGTTVGKSSPVQVTSIAGFPNIPTSWSLVRIGTSHTVALSENRLFTWGLGTGGRTGEQNFSFPSVINPDGQRSWTAIAAGLNYNLALRSDSLLFAWGGNNAGQLGDGTTISRSSPVQIGSSSWIAIAAGRYHSLAIRLGGTLFTWGSGASGQLGDGTTISKSSPVQIGSSSWTAISGGGTHSAAISSTNKLFTWGLGTSGQCADGFFTFGRIEDVGGIDRSWTMVSNGPTHTVAIRADGLLFGWGFNNYGQLGDGTQINKPSPIQIGSSSWTFVSTGIAHTLGIRSGGTLFAWGRNSFGQLGDGTTINKSSPVQIGSSSWTAVDAGDSVSVGLTTAGTLFTWGLGTTGQLGDGTAISKSSPVQIGSSSWTAVSAGLSTVAAIRSGGTLFAWGLGTSGQIGDGSFVSRSSPVQVASDESFTLVSAGASHIAAIRSGGTLFTWGFNNTFQLGLNYVGIPPTPFWNIDQINTYVTPTSPTTSITYSWTALASGVGFNLGITNNGTLFAWGKNVFGQIGDGTTVDKLIPVQIGSSSWTAVAASLHTSYAIRSGGTLFAWGRGTENQLGDGSAISKSSPVQIGSSSWTAVSGGLTHAVAIRSGGTLFSWGANGNGQLGDGTLISRNSPVQIGSSSWTAVQAGGYHSIGIRSGGTLFTWGNNGFGQIGDRNSFNINYSSPVQIGSSSWTVVAAGMNHSLAIRSDGILFTWGLNLNGQLGDGTLFNRSSPVQIGTQSWTALGVGSDRTSHSAAIRTDGALFMWGSNSDGALGTGDFSNLTIPTRIGSGSWTLISMGGPSSTDTGVAHGAHSMGIGSDNLMYSWGGGSLAALNSPPVNVGRIKGIGLIPTQIGSSSWIAVSSGTQHTLALASGGTLFGWGRNTSGQTGVDSYNNASGVAATNNGTAGFFDNISTPTAIPGTFIWSSISAGDIASSAIGTDGLLYTAGHLNTVNVGQTSRGLGGSFPTQIGSSSWTMVSAGENHTLAINAAGTLFSAGLNSSGQLGDGTRSSRSNLTLTFYNSSWTAVSAGFEHSLAVRSGGTLFSWGLNNVGQLGDGTTISLGKSIPNQIGSSSWTAVSARVSFSVATRSDGAIFTWGLNSSGQLGDGTTINKSSPVLISTSWNIISAGGTHVAALSSGYLFTWGGNSVGQLSRSSQGGSLPTLVSDKSWIALSTGSYHNLAIRSDNLMFGWGLNSSGQLGINNTINQLGTTQIGSSSWTAVGAGRYHSHAVRSDGILFSWGNNNAGQFGDGTTINKSSPVTLNSQIHPNTSWTTISAGRNHTSLLRNDGVLFTAGLNTTGQTGRRAGGRVPFRIPTFQYRNISANTVVAGRHNAYILTNTGTIWNVGGNPYNSDNIINSGTISPVTQGHVAAGGVATLSPAPVVSSYKWGSSWTAVGITLRGFATDILQSYPHTFAFNSGILFGWGENGRGGSLDGDSTLINFVDIQGFSGQNHTGNQLFSPVAIMHSSEQGRIPSMKSNGVVWSSIPKSRYQPVFISDQGEIWTKDVLSRAATPRIGSGIANRLVTSPTQVGSSSWTAIYAGQYTSFGFTTDNRLFAWGRNSSFQTGIDEEARESFMNSSNVKNDVLYPTQLKGSWAAVSIGGTHGALLQSGSSRMVMFGWNEQGALGRIYNESRMTQIGMSSWVAISAGRYVSSAVRSDGKLFTWGRNNYGVMGGDEWLSEIKNIFGYSVVYQYPRSCSPVLLNTSSFTLVSSKFDHMIATTVGGKLFSWGRNQSGQVGDGTTIDKSSPVQIGGTNSFTLISAGRVHSAAISTEGWLWTWGLGSSGQTGDSLIDAKVGT